MNIESTVLYRDADLLVLNKPSGLSFLADRSGAPCLWDALKAWNESANTGLPRPVHRLDKGTSGTLLVALSSVAQQSLNRQFQAHRVGKTYLAVVLKTPHPPAGVIDLPLCPGRKGRYRVAGPRAEIALTRDRRSRAVWRLPPDAAAPSGKTAHPSRTDYRVLRAGSGGALVMLRPRTGRAHRIRVHLAWLGWPIAGDSLYGAKEPKSNSQPFVSRLMLHCRMISVRLDWKADSPPRPLVFRSPVPDVFLS
jgi:tRNA pseudouridine32 synthase/23S rRNA pseudouridine746 synthase/23S rRNA pseudouridine1911/1915/1917 synthase